MDSPNISDIIGLIMKNPEMLGMIKNLAAESTERQEESLAEEAISERTEEISPEPQDAEPTLAHVPHRDERSVRRKHLLTALKPYVSDGRAKAIDSMLSFSELFDVIRRG